MIIRRADADTEAGIFPDDPTLFEKMTAYNQEMLDAGILRAGEGLHPTSRGALIRFSNGTPTVTDGPFAQATQLIAGFTIIEVASREEALRWVQRWPKEDGTGNVTLELRQIYENEDFGEAMSPELREQEDRMRAQIAQNTQQ